MSTDYPEAMGSDGVIAHPKELQEYLRLIEQDASYIRGLDDETELYGKTFNDSLHGHFEVHPLLVLIIDTPEFQRLRLIKALGCTNYVYPGATHTRFEHCIGVSHLAGKLVKALADRQPELHVSRSEILSVQIAGLLHDLGHGPFSHLWEKIVNAANPGAHWEHEEMSLKMFDHLLANNPALRPAYSAFGLQTQDVELIKDLIVGRNAAARPANKRFLFDIVANKRNGLDVDKWDYLARDSRQVGSKDRFDCERFILFSRVLWKEMPEGGEPVTLIAFRDKEIDNILDMFHMRFKMHKRVYQHRVVKVVEAMLCEAITLANPHMWSSGSNGQCRWADAYNDIAAYRKLSDNIIEDIYNADADDNARLLGPARAIIHRIKTRNFYPLLGRTQLVEQYECSEADVKLQLIQVAHGVQSCNILPAVLDQNLLVIKSCYNYGMGRANPLDYVTFYRKDEPDVARNISTSEMSTSLPAKFQDCELLIHYRSEDADEIGQARDVVESWAQRNKISLNNSSVRMSTMKRKRRAPEEHSGAQETARKKMSF